MYQIFPIVLRKITSLVHHIAPQGNVRPMDLRTLTFLPIRLGEEAQSGPPCYFWEERDQGTYAYNIDQEAMNILDGGLHFSKTKRRVRRPK